MPTSIRTRFATLALLVSGTLLAQTQSFDIATFSIPRGWNRTESNGILLLQDRRNNRGRVEFCQIYLFPSRPSQGNPAQNFAAEWQARVAGGLGIAARPMPQTEQTPDGWTALTAVTDTVKQGVPMRVLLMTATGFGRAVSVLVSASPNTYQAELTAFFKGVNFHAGGGGATSAMSTSTRPGNAAGSTISGNGSLSVYSYTLPDQWTGQDSPGRIVLVSPQYSNGERCSLTMFAPHSASRPLADDAIGNFRDLFKADPLTTYPSPPPKLAHGISPQGWEYFYIRKLVGGQEGDGKGMGTILLEARIGDQIAAIAGTSKDFIVSNCFGELVRDVWPKFFYSLQFKNVQATGQQQAAIQQRLAGQWISATGTVGLSYQFNATGRYMGAGAARHVQAINSTEVLETTNAYFGDGSYAINNNNLVLTGDDQRRSSFLFRVQQVSKDSGHTWSDELCLLDPSLSGEVCYRKQ